MIIRFDTWNELRKLESSPEASTAHQAQVFFNAVAKLLNFAINNIIYKSLGSSQSFASRVGF